MNRIDNFICTTLLRIKGNPCKPLPQFRAYTYCNHFKIQSGIITVNSDFRYF